MADTAMAEEVVHPPAQGGGEAAHEQAGGAPEQPGGLEPKLLKKALKKRVMYIEKYMECVCCVRGASRDPRLGGLLCVTHTHTLPHQHAEHEAAASLVGAGPGAGGV